MTFDFTVTVPQDLSHQEPILISGADSLQLDGRAYLVVDDFGKRLFEIRYEYHCSPFKQALILDTVVAVGFEAHFYLFDFITKSNLLSLEMDGYFGHLYLHNDKFYVADSAGLYCINKSGTTLWSNKGLAVDGVIIHDFDENKIFGSGEWDPPGGWQDFIVDERSGTLIE
ncbi:MAG: hypothetical protein ABIX01_13130 [Chitinophagaceae bacterium]